MYRVHLFDALIRLAGKEKFNHARILEIGPKDGLDSLRLQGLKPEELVMIDLSGKRDIVHSWLDKITCKKSYIEGNFMYLDKTQYAALGAFDLIWCTGVLYHNAEQLRLLRKLYLQLNKGGYLVIESATARRSRWERDNGFVEIHYPKTYRDTGTITHLPSAHAIRAWLTMVGFPEIHESRCYEKSNRNLIGSRIAYIAHKTGDDDGMVYYRDDSSNIHYRFGDSS